MEDIEVRCEVGFTDSGCLVTNNLEKVKMDLEKLFDGFEEKEIKDLKEAKEIRATINKMHEALEKERKRIKAIINQPYAEFEKNYNEAIARLVECKAYISDKVAELEPSKGALPKGALPKKTMAFIMDLDIKQQQKVEEFLIKQGIAYKVKVKE